MFIIFSVFYTLIAAAMIVLVLMQRGAGADAGSGFGGGASSTVFGARGSASFLTRATAVLATLFFLLSLGMGIYLGRSGVSDQPAAADLGVMAGMGTPATPGKAAPPKTAPADTGSDVPKAATPDASSDVPAPQAPAKGAEGKADGDKQGQREPAKN